VRELLIYIEDGIAEILKNYRWEFNTAQNRLEIKTLSDNFLAQILNDGGLYDFQNIMDSTNNTTEVIDNNIGIIDTYVEPVRGMGILVNRVTILSTGSIQAGNF
jgi:phage tail sheath protein FI